MFKKKSQSFECLIPKSSSRCEIIVGQNLLSQKNLFKARSGTHAKSQVSFIVSDEALLGAERTLRNTLESLGSHVNTLFVRVDESVKTFEKVYPFYSFFYENKIDRHSCLFAVGGGVIGDITGFLAGTLLRGVPWVGIPTTLVAQVDSSLGGKTGMNHSWGKNLIGVFHHPEQVVCDTSLLSSLPFEEMVSGLGEIIKYALALDFEFFTFLEKHWKKILNQQQPWLNFAIWKSLNLKGSLVRKDYYDQKGIREVLNLGHTLGHSFECVFTLHKPHIRIKHGEAVLWGIYGVLYLSLRKGHLSQQVFLRITQFLKQLPLPSLQEFAHGKFSLPVLTQEVLLALQSDKKSRNGKPTFILLRALGKTVRDTSVSLRDLAWVLEKLWNL